MKRILFFLLLSTTLVLHAQDEILRRYTEHGDVNTTYVSRGMLELVPLEQFDVPGLSDVARRIDHMTILVSRGDKMGKEMGNKLPKQLIRKGFVEQLNTNRDGRNIRVLQSRHDPTRVVMVLYMKPHATVVSMKGDFAMGVGDIIPPAN